MGFKQSPPETSQFEPVARLILQPNLLFFPIFMTEVYICSTNHFAQTNQSTVPTPTMKMENTTSD